jgi:hypothetical protein
MKVSLALFTSFFVGAVQAVDCELTAPTIPIVQSLFGLHNISFQGFKPLITRVEGAPMIKILKYSSEPLLEVENGKLVVSSSSCGLVPTVAPGGTTSAADRVSTTFVAAVASSFALLSLASGRSTSTALASVTAVAMGAISMLPTTSAQEDQCEQIVEVEISGPVKSVGAVYMEDMIKYDESSDSYHWKPEEGRSNRIDASREFRKTASGCIYNCCNKVLMGMAQSRILNEAPLVTPRDDVIFDLPVGVVLPETDEGIMGLSVLEQQALLRAGSITSVELTNIALSMLEKYAPEFNILEVELKDLALRIAGEADVLFAAGTYVSAIQGIPFAIKDTYDVAGYATAYGSFQFLYVVAMFSCSNVLWLVSFSYLLLSTAS